MSHDGTYGKGPVPTLKELERRLAFYDHLDACEQCREHPFDLCKDGRRLFDAAARALVAPQERETP